MVAGRTGMVRKRVTDVGYVSMKGAAMTQKMARATELERRVTGVIGMKAEAMDAGTMEAEGRVTGMKEMEAGGKAKVVMGVERGTAEAEGRERSGMEARTTEVKGMEAEATDAGGRAEEVVGMEEEVMVRLVIMVTETGKGVKAVGLMKGAMIRVMVEEVGAEALEGTAALMVVPGRVGRGRLTGDSVMGAEEKGATGKVGARELEV